MTTSNIASVINTVTRSGNGKSDRNALSPGNQSGYWPENTAQTIFGSALVLTLDLLAQGFQFEPAVFLVGAVLHGFAEAF